jgi:hypothetical protein
MSQNELEARVARAIGDPGSIVGRKHGPSWGPGNSGWALEEETAANWSTRAVMAVIRSLPAQRRVWFAGDPEPEIGTRVLVAGQVWTRHYQLRWILEPGGNGCPGVEWRRLWRRLNDERIIPLVEILTGEAWPR